MRILYGSAPPHADFMDMSEKANELLKILAALIEIMETLPEEPLPFDEAEVRHLLKAVNQAGQRLHRFRIDLDPIRLPNVVFDPMQPDQVGEIIGRMMTEQPCHPLDTVPKFYGAGVYAIYYKGDFRAYRPIRGTETPIYVGVADPKTPDAPGPVEQGTGLCSRLSYHAKSIKAATNLRIEDFECRYLVVRSGFQKAAEDYLLNRFKPVWNNEQKVCFGLGKHGDAPETRRNKRSPWDTLHPGRPWATREGNIPYGFTPAQIEEQIAEHFRRNPPKR